MQGAGSQGRRQVCLPAGFPRQEPRGEWLLPSLVEQEAEREAAEQSAVCQHLPALARPSVPAQGFAPPLHAVALAPLFCVRLWVPSLLLVPRILRGSSFPDLTKVMLIFPCSLLTALVLWQTLAGFQGQWLLDRRDQSSVKCSPSPKHSPCCLRRCFHPWQAQRESPGEPSPYTINTVQVNGQEKYLIVSLGEGGAAATSAWAQQQAAGLGCVHPYCTIAAPTCCAGPVAVLHCIICVLM